MTSERGGLLVLGGSGFLGAQVVLRALARDEPVISASRDPHSFPRSDDPRLQRVVLDVAEEDALERELDELRPSRVILCTALASLDACEKDFELAVRVNTGAAGRVAQWCSGADARLVFVSTDLVFGREPPEHGERYREDDYPAPLSLYGVTKMAGETAVLEARGNAVVARLPLMYGDPLGRPKGASGSLATALERGERPQLFTDEFRTPLDVADAADALLELAEHEFRGTLHVAGPERISRYDLGLAILHAGGRSYADARATLRSATRADAGVEATRPTDVSLDVRLAQRVLRTKLRAPAEALARR
jgi:dTDP-4-dehydrorhamnose reductase